MDKKFGIFLLSLIFLLVAFFVIFNKQGSNQIINNSIPTNQNTTQDNQNSNFFNTGSTLDLSNQGLEKLPADVLNKTNLEELNISNNKLTGALPAEIRHLANLRVLNASNNLMTGVPAEIGQLQNLEVLDFSNNKLTGLPNELGNLKRLKRLNLSGNQYSKQDLEIIKKGLSPSVEIIGL